MTDLSSMVVEFGWPASASTGWGLVALHAALGLSRLGVRVHLPTESDLSGVSPVLWPVLRPMLAPGDLREHRIRIDAYGNHWPPFHAIPNRTRVLFTVFEDTAIPPAALDALRQYDLILTPSTWAQLILTSNGIPSTVWHQGYDDTLFQPAPRRRPADAPLLIFSGGKLEFRKGQDIVVEAFRRFRATPEGRDAQLAVAWGNRWPQTMQSIWASGYVKGVPVIRDGRMDVVRWLEANGVPSSAVIDLGFPTQAEMAQAIRECDVALFPNRCEGATNMMLPEVLACGIPAIVSQNCGHRDVPRSLPLDRQSPVTLRCPLFEGMEGWGESDPDECVRRLQYASASRSLPTRDLGDLGAPLSDRIARHFSWTRQSHRLAVDHLAPLLSLSPAHA